MIFQMSRKKALELGIIVCGNCGYPPNNHFGDNGEGSCAHDKDCKKFKESSRDGIKIVKTLNLTLKK